jgi:hypothetical protein
MKTKCLIGALMGSAVVFAALLGACKQPTDSPEPAPKGKAAVSLTLAGIPGSGGATWIVYPDTSAIAKYALVFTPTAAGEANSVEVDPPASGAAVEMDLVAGT